MKTLFAFLVFVFFLTLAQAQEIEATLSGNTSSEGFSVKNNAGVNLFRITGDGNIGIGTTSPTQKLDVANGSIQVSSTSATETGLFLGNTENTNSRIWQLASSGSSGQGGAGAFAINQFTQSLEFEAAIFVINTDGKVGIGTTSPMAKLDVVGNVKIADGTQGANKVLTSDANGNTSWATHVSAGSYTPIWTSVQGFTNTPNFINARYTRVGSLVTVVASFDFTTVTGGVDNKAYITLPPDLPVAGGNLIFLVSGVFANGNYINSSLEPSAGIVGYRNSTTVHLMLQDATVGGAVTSWCNFSYVTDAP